MIVHVFIFKVHVQCTYTCTTLKRNTFDIRLNFLLIQFYKHYRDQIQEIDFYTFLAKGQ